MTDRLTDYGLKSLAYFIGQSVPTLTESKIVTPDFDWNMKPDPSNPGTKIYRDLPFVGVLLIGEDYGPFSVGNILYDESMICEVHVLGATYTQMIQLAADVKQSLIAAVNPVTSGIGIPLYNFAVASGAFYAIAGTLQVNAYRVDYLQPESNDESDNRKYRAVVTVNLTAFKDNTATLLENMGRVSLTDS